MAENDVEVRIGAHVDRGVDVAFRGVEDSARRAASTVASTTAKARDAQGRFTASVRAQEAAWKQVQHWARTGSTEIAEGMSRASRSTVDFGKQATQNFDRVKLAFSLMARETSRDIAKFETKLAKTGYERGGRIGAAARSFDPVSAAMGLGRRALGAAVGVGRELAQGMGVQTDLGQHIGAGISLEKVATQLSNAAYMPGQAGANGQRQDPRDLIKEVRDVGMMTATDPNAAMGGLRKFVEKTGDLETARKILADMVKLAAATGTEMEDMVSAAADVSNTLGEVPNKAEEINKIMSIVAAQGKTGAVEIKDLATQMAKIGAASSQFGTDRTRSFAEFGAIAQVGRRTGGSASATQAATATMSFMNTFSKGARLHQFKQFGVETQDAAGQNRYARDIIVDSLRAASSDKHGGMAKLAENMGKMFMDVRARAAVRGFETEYRRAGGGKAGEEAVREQFDKLTQAIMMNDEINKSFANHMQTAEAQVQLFNNEMAKAADELRVAIMPALRQLAPMFVSLVKQLSTFMGVKNRENDDKAVSADLASGNVIAMSKKIRGSAAGAQMSAYGLARPGEGDELAGKKDVLVPAGAEEAMAQADKDLTAAIAAKKAEQSKLEGERNQNVGFAAKGGKGTREEYLAFGAKQGVDTDAGRFAMNEKELTNLTARLDELREERAKLHGLLSSPTGINVVIVGDTTATKPKAPDAVPERGESP